LCIIFKCTFSRNSLQPTSFVVEGCPSSPSEGSTCDLPAHLVHPPPPTWGWWQQQGRPPPLLSPRRCYRAVNVGVSTTLHPPARLPLTWGDGVVPRHAGVQYATRSKIRYLTITHIPASPLCGVVGWSTWREMEREPLTPIPAHTPPPNTAPPGQHCA
jgi:hypothetical protein